MQTYTLLFFFYTDGDILDTLRCILIFFHLMMYLGEFLVLARKERPLISKSCCIVAHLIH